MVQQSLEERPHTTTGEQDAVLPRNICTSVLEKHAQGLLTFLRTTCELVADLVVSRRWEECKQQMVDLESACKNWAESRRELEARFPYDCRRFTEYGRFIRNAICEELDSHQQALEQVVNETKERLSRECSISVFGLVAGHSLDRDGMVNTIATRARFCRVVSDALASVTRIEEGLNTSLAEANRVTDHLSAFWNLTEQIRNALYHTEQLPELKLIWTGGLPQFGNCLADLHRHFTFEHNALGKALAQPANSGTLSSLSERIADATRVATLVVDQVKAAHKTFREIYGEMTRVESVLAECKEADGLTDAVFFSSDLGFTLKGICNAAFDGISRKVQRLLQSLKPTDGSPQTTIDADNQRTQLLDPEAVCSIEADVRELDRLVIMRREVGKALSALSVPPDSVAAHDADDDAAEDAEEARDVAEFRILRALRGSWPERDYGLPSRSCDEKFLKKLQRFTKSKKDHEC